MSLGRGKRGHGEFYFSFQLFLERSINLPPGSRQELMIALSGGIGALSALVSGEFCVESINSHPGSYFQLPLLRGSSLTPSATALALFLLSNYPAL